MNCLIENLNKNTNYEIRICNNDNKWSQIIKLKTPEFISLILYES